MFRRFDRTSDGSRRSAFAVAVDGGSASIAALVTPDVDAVEVGLRDEDLAGKRSQGFAFFIESRGLDLLLSAASQVHLDSNALLLSPAGFTPKVLLI